MTTKISFLLDETGSMGNKKDVTLDALNEYVKTLQGHPEGEYLFTLVTFNSTETRKVHVNVPIAEVPEFSDYHPNYSTPLIDAAMKIIEATEKVVEDGDKVIVIIQSDGEENCSTEYTNNDLVAKVKERTADGWEFIFLGVDMDAYHQAAKFGISKGNTISASRRTYGTAMAAMASNTLGYAEGQSLSMGFSREQKEQAEGDPKPPKMVEDLDLTTE